MKASVPQITALRLCSILAAQAVLLKVTNYVALPNILHVLTLLFMCPYTTIHAGGLLESIMEEPHSSPGSAGSTQNSPDLSPRMSPVMSPVQFIPREAAAKEREAAEKERETARVKVEQLESELEDSQKRNVSARDAASEQVEMLLRLEASRY
jgi:hypothetical protein